ncbi:methylated-DNA--[protein]-cysteine S-methyltransferase [Marinifilum sp. N1E240]|uniref:methylated-DNA--[protein]-cysteine S-methyltransferase n=1 Tax=Marinifilum sp. N1E240 TaxID=2608082 RepID=UPI00128E2161|nr:methylated-DNA--[protein]-cysteine S-methyltransferase [Marinifilum sp. N1E240]MPQ46406.1 methylated-DNA--[protein]-cysteine S-methyltransferase [Marinifilum sp. N1E240]
MFYYDIISTPIGQLLLLSSDEGLKKILFEDQFDTSSIDSNWYHDPSKLNLVKEQLDAYFSKTLTQFNLKLAPEGTVFQKQIWNELLQIPHGQIKSYQDIANAIDKPTACRAVGMANSQNPIPIVIPCHRVIGKNGRLTGYAGGLENKSKLLQIENIDLEGNSKQYQLF